MTQKAEVRKTGLGGYTVEGTLTSGNSRMRWIANFQKGKLVIMAYYYEERQSTRHKWTKKHVWDKYDNRGSDMQEPHGVPFGIADLMMKEFIQYISKNLELVWKETK